MNGPEDVVQTSPLSTTLHSAQALGVKHDESTPPLPSVVASAAAQDAGDLKSRSTTPPNKNIEHSVSHEEVSTGFEPLQLPGAADVEASITEKSNTISGHPLDKPAQHASSSRESHGIYLRSPALMVSCWIFGIIFSLCHHLFYSHFDGSIVGSPDEEQWNIRFVFASDFDLTWT